ncbi:MAG: toxin-antitoxin system HicB family antitoxin [Acidobacteriota bacterium]
MLQKQNKIKAASPNYKAEEYNYTVAWSEEDEAFIGRVSEFSSLAAHGETLQDALLETIEVVRLAIEDLQESGEAIPTPFNKRSYSGRFNVRMPEHLHRQLAIEAQRQGVSLNRWVNSKLELPVPVE